MAIGLIVLRVPVPPDRVVAAMSFRDAGRNAPYTLENYQFTWAHWADPFGAAGIVRRVLAQHHHRALATLGASSSAR